MAFAQRRLQTFPRATDRYVHALISFHVANCKKKIKYSVCLTFITFAQCLTTHCDAEPIAPTPSSLCVVELSHSELFPLFQFLKVQCVHFKEAQSLKKWLCKMAANFEEDPL